MPFETRSHHRFARCRAFTLMEMMLVVAIIILLLSILIVAVNQAAQTGQGTKSRFLLASMSEALVRFKEDTGYEPPVLDDDRLLLESPDPDGPMYASQLQGWSSRTSLAEFLIGYDEGRYDGYGYADLGETPAVGIRSPGLDGLWGGSIDANGDGTIDLDDRNPPLDGQVLGPYLELKDPGLLGAIDAAGAILFPGDPGYDDSLPKTIVDYWGNPIHYYRRPYPPGALRQSYRAVPRASGGSFVPSLSDVYVLRLYDIPPGAEVDGLPDKSALQDRSTTLELRSAAFALLSAGPDRSLDTQARRDEADADGDGVTSENADNLVEVGP